MIMNSCVANKKERLYVFQIFVNHVTLYLEKYNSSLIGIDLKFGDLPLFRIFQADFISTKEMKKRDTFREIKQRVVNINSGKSYLFCHESGDLIQTMRTLPIILDVYKVKAISKCPEGVIKDPLGETKIPLPGCLCDQIIMACNDRDKLPRSYTVKNTFGLVNRDFKPAGLVYLQLRLTCLGKYLMGQFSIADKTMMFKNEISNNEFKCTKVPLPDEDDRREAELERKICSPDQEFGESELDSPPRPLNVSGLIFVCEELSETDGYLCEIPPPALKHSLQAVTTPGIAQEKLKFCLDISVLHNIPQVPDDRNRKFYRKDTPCIGQRCLGGLCLAEYRKNNGIKKM